MDATVVLDIAKISKAIHEVADARPGRADHLRESLLGDWRYKHLGLTGLTELCHQKECSRQSLLAGIEELINKVFLGADATQEHEL